MNIRFFHLNEKFGLMDTIGNSQLDLQDVEAIFPRATYDAGHIDYYLRNVTHFLLGLDHALRSGEAIDGPGERDLSWTTEVLKEGTAGPPREVLRIYPKAHSKAIQEALAAIGRSPT